MKKLLSLLLVLLLTLTACGSQPMTAAPDGSAPNDAEDTTPEASALRFALAEPLTYAESYSMDDGTALLTVSYTLPQLELRTADGAVYALPTTSNNADVQPKEVAVRDAFNAEMAQKLEESKSWGVSLLADAREHYESLDDEYREYWTPYADELEVGVGYMTEGLVSVSAVAYSYYGGAHPNSGYYSWNFDLTTGEFLTLDSLNAQSSNINDLGETLAHTLALYILDEIDAQGLAEEYYEDYYSYIFDLAANANFCFTASGMTVIFDAYVIAPYAAGAQEFTIPYHAFYNALDPHTQSLLDVPRDEVVLADYKCAETLWSWFYLMTAPIDTGTVGAEVDGIEYYRVACGALNSLEALRDLLTTYVSAEVADEWLGTGRFLEVNGGLYTVSADRGSNWNIANERFTVEWADETSGTVVQTVDVQDYDASGELALTGATEVYEYPFTLTDGHAVFSAFPCPW